VMSKGMNMLTAESGSSKLLSIRAAKPVATTRDSRATPDSPVYVFPRGVFLEKTVVVHVVKKSITKIICLAPHEFCKVNYNFMRRGSSINIPTA